MNSTITASDAVVAINDRPTLKQLRAAIKRLGITKEGAGQPIDSLLARARVDEDPLGFLATFASGEPAKEKEPPPDENAKVDEPPPAEDAKVPLDCLFDSVEIHVPIAPVEPGTYVGRNFHVDVHLDDEQAAAFRGLQNALDAGGQKLSNGRRVDSRGNVIRWIVEQIVEAKGKAR